MLGSVSPRLAALLLPGAFKLPELRIRSRDEPEDASRTGSTLASLKQLLGRLGKLRTSLERLEKAGRSTEILPGGSSSIAAGATSDSGLGLVSVPTFTTLRSTEQVNTRPTSFTPRSPSFGPTSTTQPNVAGTYFGAQGNDTLTFTALDSGTIGTGGPKKIEITDGSSNVIDTLDFNGVAADTPLTLSNGLTLSFGAGDLTAGESFTVDVSTSVGSAVDPDSAFDGLGDSSPNFEEGLAVTDGEFKVNGVTIMVAANDTINSVLAKINADPATGVTATFDAVREEVVLTQNSSGSANDIVVDPLSDTSGFLAATKLDTASSVFPQFTTLESGEEVNTTLTSFSPVNPSFGPSSTTQPTIGGTYSGNQGTTTLTLKAKDNGTVGSSGTLRFDVKDGGTIIETIDFGGLAADTPITLSNGLTVSLSAGTVKKNESFTVDVSTAVGSAVDPTKAFDGTGVNDPGFEADESVNAGSFEVNGVKIDVLANDTINSVLAKIDASAAGVTASFDASRERIVLTQTTAGSSEPITFATAPDTSGFLKATKLDLFSPIPGGGDDEAVDAISTVAALSGISTGDLDINGVTISVDTSTDSLNDVIAAINGSAAGVTASFDSGTNLVTITSEDPAADLVLANSTSGFFSAVNITPGTLEPTEGAATAGGEALSKPVAFENQLESFGKELDSIFRESFEGVDEELLPAIEEVLSGAISESFAKILGESGDALRSRFGIDFDFSNAESGVSSLNSRSLARSLDEEFDGVTDFLFRETSRGQKDGLVVSLIETLKELEGTFKAALRTTAGETSGILVDLSV